MPISKKKEPGFIIRHYCQGIGDCHLLRFERIEARPYWMLIDCGIHTSVKDGSKFIDDIVQDIYCQTGGEIDVLVLTHEHTDHISAFRESSGRFAKFQIGEVWMAWTESPNHPKAQELDKFKQRALTALSGASRHLHAVSSSKSDAAPLRDGIDQLLAFSFGAQGETVRSMRDAAAKLARRGVKYLDPGNAPITIPGSADVRVYVLAPSLQPSYLNIIDRVGERYQMASDSQGLRIAETLTNAFSAAIPSNDFIDMTAPFDPSLGTRLSEVARSAKHNAADAISVFAHSHYYGPCEPSPLLASANRKRTIDPHETDQLWRGIDFDWLNCAGALAMQLDSKTNNTSLVLAFEIVASGRVFLFAADAQIGNWMGWHDKDTCWTLPDGTRVTAADLLQRTVYYKVGHHGSENATAKGQGLELMTSGDLTAFVPTNKQDAENVRWGEMPFHSLVAALQARCGPRVVRADDPKLAAQTVPFQAPSGSIQAIRVGMVGGATNDPHRAWIEFDVA